MDNVIRLKDFNKHDKITVRGTECFDKFQFINHCMTILSPTDYVDFLEAIAAEPYYDAADDDIKSLVDGYYLLKN